MIPIEEKILNMREEIIQIRRELHKIPEVGFCEHKTSQFIIQKLEEYGIEVYKNIAKTGIIGVIKGKEEKSIAFRADMDALTIQEETNFSYASQNEGMMHACGHDAHMTILLGFAKYLSMGGKELPYSVVFLFQPAEEGPGGALPMIAEGIIERFHIHKIIGLHVYPQVEEGKIGCRVGPMMAQTGEFDMVISGCGGHGAIPQNAIDSIVIASNIISSFQTIISRNINPIEGAVLTIGKMWGGERRNIIAEKTYLEGTIRAFEEEVYEKIKKRMKEISKGIEKMYDCSIELIFRDMYPAVVNDKEMVKALQKAVGDENMKLVSPQMIAEDFSYYQKKVQGLFFFLGVNNKDQGHIYPLHHCKFSFNEEILLTGIQIYKNLLIFIEEQKI
ncbi:M20 metallopeptidase family protein [Inediibacterium massiliense]|uniref:M20 metallopeptidase family protein n=1 Tax=Inediibacterium massiliense TaxID=1658111 RepID=UPI000DA621B8|nr:M20 family metallopeptidase [Inediibacterium massiliense]